MANKIVLQNDIDLQYQKFKELTNDYAVMAKEFFFRLSLVSGAFRRSGGQTTIVSTCRLQSRRLFDIAMTLHDGAELLKLSKDTMRNLDETIRQEINNTDLLTLNQLTYGEETSDSVVYTQEQYEKYLRENEVIEKYNNEEKIEISDYEAVTCGKATFYFEWGCTWYAAHRFKEVTGTSLEFTESWGNDATNWDNNIDKNLFNVNPTTDISNIVSPAVAVQESNGLGHVVFIEAVRDGKVYYSESSYPNTSIAGRIQCKSIDDFSNLFQSIITAK